MSASLFYINSRTKLYRRFAALAIAGALLLAVSGPAAAQSRRKQKGPRAIAIVQWRADAKDKAVPVLVPVAILEDGKFYDAGLYKAAPSPMPLLFETVYEAQDEGELLGYFTIRYQARTERRRNWIALGEWKSAAPHVDDKFENRTQSAEIVRDRSGVPTGANPGDNGDDRDLNKKTATEYDEHGREIKKGDEAKDSDKGTDRPTLHAPGSQAAKPGTDTTTTTKKQPDDPDRPTIKRQTTSAGAKPPAPTQSAPASTPAQNTKPTDTASSAPTGTADPDRPELKRGKQTPRASKPDTDPSRPIIRRKPREAEQKEGAIPVPPRILARGPRTGVDAEESVPTLQRTRVYEAVAISDADVDPLQSYRYKMAADDRDALSSKMTALAQSTLDEYLKSIGVGSHARVAEKPPIKAGGARNNSAARKIAADTDTTSRFADSQIEVLDLTHSNDPVLVFSGRARISSNAAGAPQYAFVTYIARVDLDGNPRKLFTNLTTTDRLDITPKLQLIDAVDADGDGRGELLFRRIASDSAEFAIYKMTPDGLTELFHGGVAD